MSVVSVGGIEGYTGTGNTWLGQHLICDLHGAKNLTDIDFVETVLVQCAHAAGAKILLKHSHIFMPQNGISSVLILMESHISIHTWPEEERAGFDAFMCGDAQPRLCLPVLERAFTPNGMTTQCLARCQFKRTVDLHGEGLTR